MDKIIFSTTQIRERKIQKFLGGQRGKIIFSTTEIKERKIQKFLKAANEAEGRTV